MAWWEGRRDENVFMEVTHRAHLGDDLLAPVSARGGRVSGSYVLVPEVRVGDVVVHYHGGRRRIEGASRAVGSPEPTSFRWAARGVSARRARAAPKWVPGVRVPLGHFVPLVEPVSFAELRRHESRIMSIRDKLQRDFGRKVPLYFPWNPYRGQSMRTSETYLAKLPREVVDLFPALRSAVATAATEMSTERIERSPVEIAEDAVADAAGVHRSRRGQGFATDQQVKAALEARAMNHAYEYFSRSWIVEDVHSNSSFDLRCIRDGVEMHVEVKGTTTAGDDVLLTPNEVQHARTFGRVVLYVVTDIEIVRKTDGTVEARGGHPVILDRWLIEDGDLKPVGFRYRVPKPDRRDPTHPA